MVPNSKALEGRITGVAFFTENGLKCNAGISCFLEHGLGHSYWSVRSFVMYKGVGTKT